MFIIRTVSPGKSDSELQSCISTFKWNVCGGSQQEAGGSVVMWGLLAGQAGTCTHMTVNSEGLKDEPPWYRLFCFFVSQIHEFLFCVISCCILIGWIEGVACPQILCGTVDADMADVACMYILRHHVWCDVTTATDVSSSPRLVFFE